MWQVHELEVRLLHDKSILIVFIPEKSVKTMERYDHYEKKWIELKQITLFLHFIAD